MQMRCQCFYSAVMTISKLDYRPFYSCVLSCLAMNASKAGSDLALIQTSLFFSCKCTLGSINNLICTIKAVGSVSRQSQLQPRCHSEARPLSRQL